MNIMTNTDTKPRVYTLCGSSRFSDAFDIVNMHLSLRGHIVISKGMFGHADEPQGAQFLAGTSEKALGELHLRKIDISDAIFVINVGGYVGASTRREIAYATQNNKTIEWLFPDTVPDAITYITIKLSRTGNYRWDGTQCLTADDADWYFMDFNTYIGQLRGNKLVAAWPGGNMRGTKHEPEPTWLAHVADQIGLELATS